VVGRVLSPAQLTRAGNPAVDRFCKDYPRLFLFRNKILPLIRKFFISLKNFLIQPLSFPPRSSGLGFCETPRVFRSRFRSETSDGQAKKVRAFLSIVHQSNGVKFERTACPPKL
jgi:hypothetical protein